jgi:hypothetical protein
MKKLLLAAVVMLLGLAGVSRAQTVVRSDTFEFDRTQAIISWDGSNPADPPYPYEMGSISLNSALGGGYGAGIDVPWQLGYLNNGFLQACNPIAFGPKVWTIGDGTQTGDAFNVSGSTTCPYYTGEYGPDSPSANLLDGFSVTANYTVIKHVSCRYGRCITYYSNVLQGGTGTVQETTIN